MKKPLGAALAVLVLGAVFFGGYLLGKSGDSQSETITADEHDRLVRLCVANERHEADCIVWIAEVIADSRADGLSYTELAEYVDSNLAGGRPGTLDDAEREQIEEQTPDVARECVEAYPGNPDEWDACTERVRNGGTP